MDTLQLSRFARGPITNPLARLALAASLLCSFVSQAAAQDRDVLLRFLPPANSELTGYSVYARDVASELEELVDIGYVAPDSDGVARATLALDAARSYRVAMTAYNDAGESARSNEIQIAAEAPSCDPALCDDGNACTADTCDVGGCFSSPLADGTQCDDGYADTVDDQCVQGACEGVLLTCRGDLDCDDGDVCNGVEVCDGGTVCLEGTPLDCGEPTACTAPRCDAAAGCLTEIRPDGAPCDDGLADTRDDACSSGICQGVAATPAPRLALEGISPGAVSPGRHTITVRGQGFVPGATLSFLGKGRPPTVESLSLVDDRTLAARVEFSGKGPKHSYRLDVLVRLPDGTQALLPGALRMDP